MRTIHQDNHLGGRRLGQDRRVSADPVYHGTEKRISGDRRKGARKRKSPRFRARDGSYVAVNSNHKLIGLIKNINEYGLAFQYVANKKQLTGMLTIHIFRNSKDFSLKDVLFKAVSDFYVDAKSPFSTIILRQCCGSFVDLADYQKSQLDRFIQNYTLREA